MATLQSSGVRPSRRDAVWLPNIAWIGEPDANPHRFLRDRPAQQQAEWPDRVLLGQIRTQLAGRPALVRADDVRLLRLLLADIALGRSYVVQAGDCAEDPGDCTLDTVSRKAGQLEVLAGTLGMITQRPVLWAGRLGGQFAKPRSRQTELVGTEELPVYRGHMINGPEPDLVLRRADPRRMLTCYDAASSVMAHLGWQRSEGRWGVSSPTWTSHEALLLDYELPLLRRDGDGRLFLGSTHWPWVGERTRQLGGAHLALLAAIANPVACKVGPSVTPEELLAICELLDPDREPGRLTLISRMGAEYVSTRLPPLVRAVKAAGHPVIWLVDPMHGNTLITPDGLKTRYLEAVLAETRDFQWAVRTSGGVAGGLHLEVTPDEVTECVQNESNLREVGDKYTSLCDPRLNPRQAVSVVMAWCG